MSALLDVRGLAIAFESEHELVPAVDGLDLALASGETLALVGESGCGKTLTALAVMDCLPGGARVLGGEIRYRGRDLLRLAPGERRALCGRELALSFQEPAGALDPVFTIGAQIAEGLRHHAGLSRKAARARAVDLLAEVDLAAEHARRYPHELSGGQRQRAGLAIALACGPSLLIADEPTSALDTRAQAELLELLAALRARREMALLLITHDLAVVAELATRMLVMYAGRAVEEGPVRELFERPAHPYTHGLLRASAAARAVHGVSLAAIPGQVPVLGQWPQGCRFHPRCDRADERCAREVPRLEPAAPGARAACHHPLAEDR